MLLTAISASSLPGWWSGELARLPLLHARPRALTTRQVTGTACSALLGSSEKEPHLVGSRESGYFVCLYTCVRTTVSTVLEGFSGLWMWPARGGGGSHYMCCHYRRQGSASKTARPYTHSDDSHPACWEHRRATEGWHARLAAVCGAYVGVHTDPSSHMDVEYTAHAPTLHEIPPTPHTPLISVIISPALNLACSPGSRLRFAAKPSGSRNLRARLL